MILTARARACHRHGLAFIASWVRRLIRRGWESANSIPHCTVHRLHSVPCIEFIPYHNLEPTPWADPTSFYGSHFWSKLIKNPILQSIQKTYRSNHWIWFQKSTKMEPTSMPKLIKNQCQNWYPKRRWKIWKFMFFWWLIFFNFIVQTICF